MEEICILRTNEKGKWSAFNMYDENSNPVRIVLPHRVSFSLFRLGSILMIDCDLGHTPGDDSWRYSRNFFYNNTEFSAREKVVA